jgi:hypothetical protein
VGSGGRQRLQALDEQCLRDALEEIQLSEEGRKMSPDTMAVMQVGAARAQCRPAAERCDYHAVAARAGCGTAGMSSSGRDLGHCRHTRQAWPRHTGEGTGRGRELAEELLEASDCGQLVRTAGNVHPRRRALLRYSPA